MLRTTIGISYLTTARDGSVVTLAAKCGCAVFRFPRRQYGYAGSRTRYAKPGTAAPNRESQEHSVIALGIILIIVGYLLPVPAFVITIGWILLLIGVVLLILGAVGRPVGGRRYWY